MWNSLLLRHLDSDLDRAHQYTLFQEGLSREDIRLRRADVQRMQEKYVSNTYAAELFTSILDALAEKEKNAPKKPKDHTPILPPYTPTPEVIVRKRTHVHAPAGSSDILEVILEDTHQIESDDASFVLPASLQESKLLEQLLRYYQQRGVVGEERNLILQTLCVTNGLHFCLRGPSGSGKTRIIDALVDLLDPTDVYKLEFASETVLMNDVERINATKVLYIPEVQKAYVSPQKTPMIAEIMKGITEGRDVTRRVAVRQGDVREYTLHSGLTVITSLALENIFRYDEETARRFIALSTDTSEAHQEAVRQAKAESAFYKGASVDVPLEKELRKYISFLLHHSSTFEVLDPFAQDIVPYIPLTQRSASFQTQYYALVAASAKFNHNRRYIAQAPEGVQPAALEKTVFVSREDHQLIFDLYYHQMLANMEALDKTKKDQEYIQQVRKKIEEHGGLSWESMIPLARQRMSEFYPAHADAWVAQEQKIQEL